ncbi:transcription termination/antitermination protein NusG [Spiroplasma endosymbiont of Amphibalanus improvisus]|uniref:transcription termination/antitermination protein NusG n=1 Tax=Spiroplasma endosymbiont of Amphibalanus improvisus TaxID=3066327 RepID=UPI00313B5C08
MELKKENLDEEFISDNKLSPDEKFKGKWYVVSCHSGREDNVKSDLEEIIKKSNKSHLIFDIRVIKEKVRSEKTKKIINKNLYPGYIFINMIMDDEAWFIVRNTTSVTGFIGSSGKGTKSFPLTEAEVKKMLRKSDNVEIKELSKKDRVLHKANFEIGDFVTIKSGPFSDQEGKVVAKDDMKGQAIVNIELFGRLTPTHIQYSDCKKDN